MNLLIVGHGKASFEMRAIQLGAALGARICMSRDDCKWADVAILVKHSGYAYARTVQAYKVPIVWDALDFWRQPDENRLTETDARARLKGQLDLIKPTLFIGATEAMAAAGGGVCLPHHSWHGLSPTPAREHVKVVAYEGSARYLGRWADWLQQACQARGWTFVINPPDLSAADIIVAFRDGPSWDGWMCREWKSGVKLVNAIAAGRPVITQPSAAWREIQPFGSAVETREELEDALGTWASFSRRDQAFQQCQVMAPSYTIEAIAEQYRRLLVGLKAEAA